MTAPGHSATAGWRSRGQALVRLGAKQLLVGAGIGVARLAGFLTGAVSARTLGPRGFADYTVAFTILTSLMQVTSFADTWMVSRWDNVGCRDGVRSAVWRIKSISALAFGGVAVIIMLIAPTSLVRLGTNGSLLLLAVLGAGAGAMTTAAASLYQASGDFRRYAVIVAAGPSLSCLLTAALAFRREPRPAVYVAAILVSYLPTAVLAYRRLQSGSQTAAASRLMREALHFGGWVTVGSIAYVAFQRLDVFLLAVLRPGVEVGIYGAAVRLSMVGALFGNTLTAVLMPPGSQARTWQDPALKRAYLSESALGILLMAAALVLAAAAAPWLIGLAFGKAY
ncbi:MAG TPA: oligosaccharide flippase family protein, partial [Steroidobacteraceae bacterium]|nr:oligosaccharide flippase family protein [Steroidobacteraceae bacterium]